ncbi:MAG: DEAD/DEAH box helicase [Acetobacter sp.]|nr:DEAD/DEAH box helicase [Acetobacter sp.]MBQ5774214.1 DEAD/DEAH box helicase [Acetobacter sp.]
MPFRHASPPLARALSARGFIAPTPVQAAVLADSAKGRDLLVSARTGSGKTVAFGLVLSDLLLKDNEHCPPPSAPLSLVIAPTRELALQVRNELEWLYAETGARIVSCVGGMEPRREARALSMGCHIVVGTPGRLCDHIRRGHLVLSQLQAVVLDEADEMLDLGFREDLEFLLDAMPKERLTLLFSATIGRDIATLARHYQNNALRIDTIDANTPHTDITYRAVLTDPSDITGAVVNILRFEEARTAIIFCHTREAVRQLHTTLAERGFSSVAISGDLGQNERIRAIESLRHGQARVCVATDVAARGIDIPELGLVIHASLPSCPETLLHRSGRTGRAGRKGTCVLLVPPARRRAAERLFQAAKITAIWRGVPTKQEISEADAARLLQASILSDQQTTNNNTSLQELADRLLTTHTPQQIAYALVDLWHTHLPLPLDVRVLTPEMTRHNRFERHTRITTQRECSRRQYPMASSWFRLSIGRADKADPKWLVPTLCKIGGLRKQDIGAIRINNHHTLVEIAQEKAQNFADQAINNAEGIKIESARPPARGEHKPQTERRFTKRTKTETRSKVFSN